MRAASLVIRAGRQVTAAGPPGAVHVPTGLEVSWLSVYPLQLHPLQIVCS